MGGLLSATRLPRCSAFVLATFWGTVLYDCNRGAFVDYLGGTAVVSVLMLLRVVHHLCGVEKQG
jgi:hypothetical protein